MSKYDTLYRDRMIAFVEEMRAMAFTDREILDIFNIAMDGRVTYAAIHKETSDEAQS